MSSDTPSKTTVQVLKLLEAYQNAPSTELREQLLQLNISLVHTVIHASVSPKDENCEDLVAENLVEIGTQGLVSAFRDFDLHSGQAFQDFAIPCIYTSIQNHSKHLLQVDTQQARAPDASNNSYRQQEAMPKCKSLRRAEEDTKLLQKDLGNPGNFAKKNTEAEANPSGELKVETMQLLQEYRSKPTARLRNRLVQINIGLVRKEAYHWVNQCSESFEDLLQVGSMGLMRAIERFDMNRGHAFSSFAVPYIRGEIQHYLRDKSPTVRMPRRWLAIYNQACKIVRQLRMELHREPNAQEVANALGIEAGEWQEIKLACQNRSPLSLDAPVSDDDNGKTSLGDLVPDSKYRSFQLAQEDSIRLYQAMSHLEDRTREIVEFVFIKEFTHREVAEILGISAVTVSRQVKKGLVLLKQIMNAPLD